jgi:hypothetical protein
VAALLAALLSTCALAGRTRTGRKGLRETGAWHDMGGVLAAACIRMDVCMYVIMYVSISMHVCISMYICISIYV